MVAVALVTVLVAASCHAQRFGQDVRFYRDINTGVLFYGEVDQYAATDPGEGVDHIWTDINDNCVTGISGGDWGDVGSSVDALSATTPQWPILTSLGTPPSSATVNCMIAEIGDDPNDSGDNESLICNDYGTANDCQNPDGAGQGYYQIMTQETDFYQEAFSDYAEVETLIVLVRDWAVEDGNTGSGSGCEAIAGKRCVASPAQPSAKTAPGCIPFRIDSTWKTNMTNGRSATWERVCLN
jgi:hypothetical protein